MRVAVILSWALLGALAAGPALGQGRYQPQGAAQRAYLEGERLREAGDALRARGKTDDAKEKYADALDALLDAQKADPAYIDVYVKLGVLHYSLARHAAALPLLEAGLKRAPANLDLRFWYGQNLLAAGKADQAVPVLEQVASQGGERFPEVLVVLGEHYYEQRDYARARPALERYLKLDPEATAVRAKLGNTYFKLGLFAEALAAFEAVQRRWPDNIQAQVNIGNALFQLGQYEKAVAVLEVALKRDPGRESVLFNLAQSYFKLGRNAEAVPYYRQFVKGRPDSFNGRYFLGSALMELGQDAAALEELAQALRLKADIPQVAYKIGILHLRNGRPADAEATLERARKGAPDDAWILSALGTVARQRGQLEVALDLHRQAVARAPKEARLQANLALTALRAGAIAEAAPALDEALKLDPREPFVRAAAATVLAARARAAVAQDAAAADKLLERALALQPADATLQADRALVRLALDDAPGARALAESALKAAPDLAAARHALGRAKLLAGDADGARADLEAAMKAEPSVGSALALAQAQVEAGQVDAAVDLLTESARSWPADADLRRGLALVHYARAAAQLGGDAAGRRTATDLRFALEAEASLPRDVAARVHYAAAVAALRRGDGREGRAHLGQAIQKGRQAGPGLTALLRAGTPASHLEYLQAHADALVRRYDLALDRLGRCQAPLERRLCKFALDRQAQALYQAGDLNGARKALDADRELGADPVVDHNLLVIAWQQKKGRDRALAAWRKLEDQVPEASFNTGVAAEAKGDQRAAWEAFRRQVTSGGPLAARAGEIADVKDRIYRFGEAGQ
ncbi:MAG: tetratricopeptide repeat protein [Myxococcales bacterium]|nr:tetratricopeptide repeat protein [Myxococcales bacterium]